jgi:hypothetical protein
MSPYDGTEWMNDDVIYDAECYEPDEDGLMMAQCSQSRPRQNEFKFTSLWRKPRLTGRRKHLGGTGLDQDMKHSHDQNLPIETDSRIIAGQQKSAQKHRTKRNVKDRESFDTFASIHLSDFDEGRDYTPPALKRGDGSAQQSPNLSANHQLQYGTASATADLNSNMFRTPDTTTPDATRRKNSTFGTSPVARLGSPSEDVFRLIRINGCVKPPSASKRLAGKVDSPSKLPKFHLLTTEVVENRGKEPNDYKENVAAGSDDENRDLGDGECEQSMSYLNRPSSCGPDDIVSNLTTLEARNRRTSKTSPKSQRGVEETPTTSEQTGALISNHLKCYQPRGRKGLSPIQLSYIATNPTSSGLERSVQFKCGQCQKTKGISDKKRLHDDVGTTEKVNSRADTSKTVDVSPARQSDKIEIFDMASPSISKEGSNRKLKNAAIDENQDFGKTLECKLSSGAGIGHRPFYAWLAQMDEQSSEKLIEATPMKQIKSAPEPESKHQALGFFSLQPSKYNLLDHGSPNAKPANASKATKDPLDHHIRICLPFNALPDKHSHNIHTGIVSSATKNVWQDNQESNNAVEKDEESTLYSGDDEDSGGSNKLVCQSQVWKSSQTEVVKVDAVDGSIINKLDIPCSPELCFTAPRPPPDTIHLDADGHGPIKEIERMSFLERKKLFQSSIDNQKRFDTYDESRNRKWHQSCESESKIVEATAVHKHPAASEKPNLQPTFVVPPQLKTRHQPSCRVQSQMKTHRDTITTHLNGSLKYQLGSPRQKDELDSHKRESLVLQQDGSPSQKLVTPYLKHVSPIDTYKTNLPSVWERKNGVGISNTQPSNGQEAETAKHSNKCAISVVKTDGRVSESPVVDRIKTLSIQDLKREFETKILTIHERENLAATIKATPNVGITKPRNTVLSKQFQTSVFACDESVQKKSGKVAIFDRSTLKSTNREVTVPIQTHSLPYQLPRKQQAQTLEDKMNTVKEMISIPLSNRAKAFENSGEKPRPTFFYASVSQKRSSCDPVKDSCGQLNLKNDNWSSIHESSTIYSSTSRDENCDHPKFVTIENDFLMRDDDTSFCLSASETRSVVCRPRTYETRKSSEEDAVGGRYMLSAFEASRVSYESSISKVGSHCDRKGWSDRIETSKRLDFHDEAPASKTKFENNLSVAKSTITPASANCTPRKKDPSPQSIHVPDSSMVSSQGSLCRSRSYSPDHEINFNRPKAADIRLSSIPMSERRSIFESRALTSSPSKQSEFARMAKTLKKNPYGIQQVSMEDHASKGRAQSSNHTKELKVAMEAVTLKKTSYRKGQEAMGDNSSRKNSLSLKESMESRRKVSQDFEGSFHVSIDKSNLTETTEISFLLDDSQLDVGPNVRPSDLLRERKMKRTSPSETLPTTSALASRRGFSCKNDTNQQQSIRCL